MADLAAWFKEITPGGVGIWTAVGLIVVALIRQGPINRKLAYEREGNLLKERATEMTRMRVELASVQAELRIARHTVNNLEQCVDTLLDMIEFAPERAVEAAKRVREMRDRMRHDIARERGEAMAAKIKDEAQAGEEE